MKEKSKVKIIRAIISAVASVVVGIIGGYTYGTNSADNFVESHAVMITGDNNTVNVENVSDLVEEYNKLAKENENLKSQNTQYFNDYKEQKDENAVLESELGDAPIVAFDTMELYIDGGRIPIDTDKSVIHVDGREYWSREIAEKFLDGSRSITIKNNAIFIGRVITESVSLFSKHINSQSDSKIENSAEDSYGNPHSNVLVNGYTQSEVSFVLDGQYNHLKVSAAMLDGVSSNVNTSFVIKADGETVYSSDTINVKTEPFVIEDVVINNCKLLTIECNADSLGKNIILYDAIVYN